MAHVDSEHLLTVTSPAVADKAHADDALVLLGLQACSAGLPLRNLI